MIEPQRCHLDLNLSCESLQVHAVLSDDQPLLFSRICQCFSDFNLITTPIDNDKTIIGQFAVLDDKVGAVVGEKDEVDFFQCQCLSDSCLCISVGTHIVSVCVAV